MSGKTSISDLDKTSPKGRPSHSNSTQKGDNTMSKKDYDQGVRDGVEGRSGRSMNPASEIINTIATGGFHRVTAPDTSDYDRGHKDGSALRKNTK
jgi:hypothetical protein